MRILLLSAYDAASHRHWRRGLTARFPEFDWTVLTLPARYFAWRVRGNSLSWAFGERDTLSRRYDLVIATSMTDLSALRGLVPSLTSTPTLVYFHENQFAYPSSGREKSSVEPQILNLYTALCADRILFNSAFNRDSLIEGARRLLKKLPDQVPPGLPERLAERALVVPVPLADEHFQAPAGIAPQHPWHGANRAGPVRIVWAARWEFDKGPDRLQAILRELERRGLDYRLALLGERFRHSPAEFDAIATEFRHRLDQFGYAATRAEYRAWLRGGDIVLSTATHEFQGLAVLEAVAAGCIPVLPDRQVYPELFDEQYLYRDCAADIRQEACAAADTLIRHASRLRDQGVSAPAVDRFSWAALRQTYARLIDQLAGSASAGATAFENGKAAKANGSG
ncbi:tRNA-queuosine alpha-mannosyltransferase domain-containing protein [Marinobacterium aestuariivivens]|uniref:tRNA-queuosine alpha-mannosyltransferase n=1 Tax=Marinobacterium aestuariivivens TaxID=1698799 RepID=A0ABW2A203_9GAMM